MPFLPPNQQRQSTEGNSLTIRKSFVRHSIQITMPAPYHSIFKGRMLFLTPNQQRQELKA